MVNTESSCFERTVPMAVGFLGRKPLLLKTLPSLQYMSDVKNFIKGMAELSSLVHDIVSWILNSSESRIDFDFTFEVMFALAANGSGGYWFSY